MLKTLQFKLRNPPRVWLDQARQEVNDCWNYANQVSFRAIRPYYGHPRYLSAFDLNKLCTPTPPGQTTHYFSTPYHPVKPLVITDPLIKKTHQSLGFACINSAVVQQVNQEYITRRNQFRRAKLKWRKSTGTASQQASGWIPFKAENVVLSLQDSSGIFRRLTGRDLTPGSSKTYDFTSSKPRFSLKILNHHFSIFHSKYLHYYLVDLASKIKSGSFSQDAVGDWYLNFAVEINDQLYQVNHLHHRQNYPVIAPQAIVGIDLNAKADSFIALSVDKKLASSGFYQKHQAKIARLSKNGHKKQLARLHRRLKRKRSNELHRQANYLVKTFQVIKVGDLKTKQLVKNKANKKVKQSTKSTSLKSAGVKTNTIKTKRKFSLHLGKSLLDNAPGEFTRLLTFKSRWAGRSFYQVNESKTTIICRNCDQATGPKGLGQLSVRLWVCACCGKLHLRDINSAQNIERTPVYGKLVDVLYQNSWPSQGRSIRFDQVNPDRFTVGFCAGISS